MSINVNVCGAYEQKAIEKVVSNTKAVLAQCDLSNMCLTIRASGSPVRDRIELSFSLSENGYGESVTGRDLNKVIEEFLRRRGWTTENSPKLLGHDGEDVPI